MAVISVCIKGELKRMKNLSGGLSGLLALLISFALTLDPEASPKVGISQLHKTSKEILFDVMNKLYQPAPGKFVVIITKTLSPAE